MSTITNHDIRDFVVEPYLGEFAADYDIDAIVSDLLERYPLSEWRYTDLDYFHPEFDTTVLDQIAQRHDISGK